MAHGFEAYALSQKEQINQPWQTISGAPDKLIAESTALMTSSSGSNRFISTLVEGTTQGFHNRLHEMSENKGETAAEFALATSIGVGLGIMNKAGGKWGTVAKWGGRAMLGMMGVDLTRRVGGSLYLAGDSAMNADHYQANVDAVAGKMGAVVVDYPLLGLTGYGTAKLMSGGKFSLTELVGKKSSEPKVGSSGAAPTELVLPRPVASTGPGREFKVQYGEQPGRASGSPVEPPPTAPEVVTTGGGARGGGERLTTQAMRERLTFSEQGQDKKAVSGFGDLFKVMAERTNLKEKPALAQERVNLLNDLKAVEAAKTDLSGLNGTRSGLTRQRSQLDGAVQSAEQQLAHLEQVGVELATKQAELATARAEVSAARRAARAQDKGTPEGIETPPAPRAHEPGAKTSETEKALSVEEAQAKFDLVNQEVQGLQGRIDGRPHLERALEQARANRDAKAPGLDQQIAALNETILARTAEVDAMALAVEGRFRTWQAQADGLVQVQMTNAETGSSGVRLEELPQGSIVTGKTPVTANPVGTQAKVKAKIVEPVAEVVEPSVTARVVEPAPKGPEPAPGGKVEPVETGKRVGDGQQRITSDAGRTRGNERPVTQADVEASLSSAGKALAEKRYVVGMRETARAIAQHLELFRLDPQVNSKAFLAKVQGMIGKIDAWEAPTKWLRSDPGKNEVASIMQRTGIDAEVMAANRNWARETQTFADLTGRPTQGFHSRPNEMPEATLSRMQQHLEARLRVENGKNFLNKLPDANRLHPTILRGLEMMRAGKLPDGTEIPDGASLIALGRRTVGGKEVIAPIGTNKPHYIDKAQYDRWYAEAQTVTEKGLGALSAEQQLALRHHHGPERFTGTNPEGFAIMFPGKNGKVIKFTDLPTPIQALLGNGFGKGSTTLRVHSEYQRLNSQRGS